MKFNQLMSNLESTGLKDEALQSAALSTASVMALVSGNMRGHRMLQQQAELRARKLVEKQNAANQ